MCSDVLMFYIVVFLTIGTWICPKIKTVATFLKAEIFFRTSPTLDFQHEKNEKSLFSTIQLPSFASA